MKYSMHWYAYPILFFALFTGLSAGAQTDEDKDPLGFASFYYISNLIEIGDSTLYYADVISDNTLPCNMEDERFGDFIVRFQSDKDFRLSRTHKPIADYLQEVQDDYMGDFAFLLNPTVNYTNGKWKEDYDDAYGLVDVKLAYIDKDNVIYTDDTEIYAKEDTDSYDKDEYLCGTNVFTLFIRVDGKWILRTVWQFG